MSKSASKEFHDEINGELNEGATPESSGAVFLPIVGSVKQMVTRYTHCGICGGRLHFNYASDFSRNTTEERAVCPECGLDSRQSLHRLQ